MRDPRFLHIGIMYGLQYGGLTNSDLAKAVQDAIDSEAFDWLRYAAQCYLVWSSSDAETICRKILRVPGMERASVFIARLDLYDAFGYLPPFAWEWIRRDRGHGALPFWTPEDQPGMPPLFPALPPTTGG